MISTQVERAFRDWLEKAWEKDGVLRKASEKAWAKDGACRKASEEGRKRCGNQPVS